MPSINEPPSLAIHCMSNVKAGAADTEGWKVVDVPVVSKGNCVSELGFVQGKPVVLER